MAGGFEDGDHDCFALDEAVALRGLSSGDSEEGAVVDGFDETIAEGAESGAQSADVIGAREVLGGGFADGTVVDDGAVGDGVVAAVDWDGGGCKVSVGIGVPGANLGDLAGGSGDEVLVAIDAGGGIVHGSEAVGGIVAQFETGLVGGVGITRRLGDAIRDALRAGVDREGGSGKSGGGVGSGLRDDGGGDADCGAGVTKSMKHDGILERGDCSGDGDIPVRHALSVRRDTSAGGKKLKPASPLLHPIIICELRLLA